MAKDEMVVNASECVLRRVEPAADGPWVRPEGGAPVPALLRRAAGEAEYESGGIFSGVADRVLRGDRIRTGHRVAGGGFAFVMAVFGVRLG